MKIETEVRRVAGIMLHQIAGTEAACEPFIEILEIVGALPPHARWKEGTAAWEAVMDKRSEIIDATFAGVCSHLLESGSLTAAFMHALSKLPSEGVTA